MASEIDAEAEDKLFDARGHHMTDDITRFSARYILYRKMAEIPGRSGEYYYPVRYKPIPVRNVTGGQLADKIAYFLKHVADFAAYDGDNAENHPLDLPIANDSYVVVELDKSLEITFASRKEGLSLGQYFEDLPTARQLYGGLKFVSDDGEAFDKEDGCRTIYFCARAKILGTGLIYKQPFAIHYEPSYKLMGTIDPDIRYPGTGGGIPDGP